jgi:hypothetical protein
VLTRPHNRRQGIAANNDVSGLAAGGIIYTWICEWLPSAVAPRVLRAHGERPRQRNGLVGCEAWQITRNETPQNETTQNETTQNETTQNETTQNETTQNETTRNAGQAAILAACSLAISTMALKASGS